jgi:hypothetical protein
MKTLQGRTALEGHHSKWTMGETTIEKVVEAVVRAIREDRT